MRWWFWCGGDRIESANELKRDSSAASFAEQPSKWMKSGWLAERRWRVVCALNRMYDDVPIYFRGNCQQNAATQAALSLSSRPEFAPLGRKMKMGVCSWVRQQALISVCHQNGWLATKLCTIPISTPSSSIQRRIHSAGKYCRVFPVGSTFSVVDIASKLNFLVPSICPFQYSWKHLKGQLQCGNQYYLLVTYFWAFNILIQKYFLDRSSHRKISLLDCFEITSSLIIMFTSSWELL